MYYIVNINSISWFIQVDIVIFFLNGGDKVCLVKLIDNFDYMIMGYVVDFCYFRNVGYLFIW